MWATRIRSQCATEYLDWIKKQPAFANRPASCLVFFMCEHNNTHDLSIPVLSTNQSDANRRVPGRADLSPFCRERVQMECLWVNDLTRLSRKSSNPTYIQQHLHPWTCMPTENYKQVFQLEEEEKKKEKKSDNILIFWRARRGHLGVMMTEPPEGDIHPSQSYTPDEMQHTDTDGKHTAAGKRARESRMVMREHLLLLSVDNKSVFSCDESMAWGYL